MLEKPVQFNAVLTGMLRKFDLVESGTLAKRAPVRPRPYFLENSTELLVSRARGLDEETKILGDGYRAKPFIEVIHSLRESNPGNSVALQIPNRLSRDWNSFFSVEGIT